MSRRSPLGAFVGGLAAGAVGSLAQNLFFAATKRLAPAPPDPPPFKPVETEQAREMPTQTVARRMLEQLMQRGPLEHKSSAGQLVHFAFGSAWGALYGLVAGSLPRRPSLGSGVIFGMGVWLASDNLLLPAFRLSAWPHHYPVKSHLYAMAAHAAYGAAVTLTFSGIERVAAPALASAGSAWMTRRVPRLVRRPARHLVRRGLRVALPVEAALTALQGA